VLATRSRGRARRRYASELRACLKRLRRWARDGPDFVHMVSVLEAEQARVRGRSELARRHYQAAAERAMAQEFRHHAALAHERRALLLHELRREIEADGALAQAAALYEQWGASGKLPKLRALKGSPH
jgi:hypothetical protein